LLDPARILVPNDANGNLTNDSLHTYTYDAENRLTKVDTSAGTYTYDGNSLRVKKLVGTTTTVYILFGNKVIAEYVNGTLSKEYVYSGSQLLATIVGSTTTYSQPDHLSTRLETNSSGTVSRTFGHLPFGDVWYETGTANKLKFTSYDRDSESSLDYAVFRYNSWRLGRFMSPDPIGGDVSNPQSLNRYSYVNNSPI
jgi:RHS repeat-associated protein